MDKKKYRVKDKKFVEPCDTLSETTEFENPREKQKDIWCWEYFSQTKPEPTQRFFDTKNKDFTKKKMAFNYCPFYSEKIDTPFKTPNAEVTGVPGFSGTSG